jgi:hypothetical protein
VRQPRPCPKGSKQDGHCFGTILVLCPSCQCNEPGALANECSWIDQEEHPFSVRVGSLGFGWLNPKEGVFQQRSPHESVVGFGPHFSKLRPNDEESYSAKVDAGVLLSLSSYTSPLSLFRSLVSALVSISSTSLCLASPGRGTLLHLAAAKCYFYKQPSLCHHLSSLLSPSSFIVT